MARTTREEKARTRERLLETATRGFRAQGVAGTSIPRLMEQIGLTHGTFYAHFESKDALVAEAYATGLRDGVERLVRRAEAAPPGQGLHAILARYLGSEHRDDPAGGCVVPALAGEVRRQGPAARHAFTVELRAFAERIAPYLRDPQDQDAALALLSGMAGGVLLARAVDDPQLSDRILEACREHLLAAFAPELPAHERE
ncbi:MAG: TetR/AcrR family transcriptional regulator [Chloroflexi bacterium]|nr:MAG: TetR/AcrR family transcriptional regulator [Chloroflexota bacterium]